MSNQLKDFLDWPYLEQVFKLERRFVSTKTGVIREQVVYGFTSLSREEVSPKKMFKRTRSYGGIARPCGLGQGEWYALPPRCHRTRRSKVSAQVVTHREP